MYDRDLQMKKNIVTIDNESLEIKQRKHNIFEILEVLLVVLLPFGTVFGVYFLFRLTGWNKVWDVSEDENLMWLFICSGSLSLSRLIGEYSFKNSYTNKQLHSCAVLSFFCATVTTAIMWLIQHILKVNTSLLVVLLESLAYFVLITIFRFILKRICFRKKQRILIIADKNEAIDYTVKFIRFGNKKDSIRALFVDSPNCDDAFIKTEIDKCDAVYFGKCIPPHTKNILTAYVTAHQKKQAYVVPNSYEILTSQVDISKLGDTMAIEARPLELNWFQRFVKRTFDIIASGLALIIFSPLIGIVALIIHLQDGGPAIYKQERVTKNGRIFTLYKFRSMVVDAEKKTGAVLMTSNDERLTRVGKFVRKTRLDELPQLWNIFKGDMSIVGPRPERPVFVEQFLKETPEYRYRLNVRAGLSGYAQVMGTYNTRYQDKLRWDLMYISKYSFALDIVLIIRTVLAVFDKDSAAGLDELNGMDYIEACGREFEIDDKHIYVKQK